MNLSKSRYCSAVQCPKMLWLKAHKPEAFDSSVLTDSVLENGNQVGDLAMGLFGDFVEVPYGDLSEMSRQTQALLEQGVPVVAEASFSWNGLFCSVDVLKNLGGRVVELYEVKSSSAVKDIYLQDVAFQVYLLTQLGYRVQRSCLVYINKDYVRRGPLELGKLFITADLTDRVRQLLPQVQDNLARLEVYMQQTQEPSDDLGMHCFAPYRCGFFGYCTRHLPQPNVFHIRKLDKKKKLKCYREGLVSFPDLNVSNVLNEKQHMQVEHALHHYPPHIRKTNIRQFLAKLSYPLYFLDFESIRPAIPLFDDSKPNQQIPFQYSLHYIEREGGPLLHKEFLAQPGTDPRYHLAQQLCRDIPLDVCTTAFNMGFEKGRIKELAQLYPDLHDHLMNIHDHIVDLMVPFFNRDYYIHTMEGSYSIKHVLPALFPDDPSLDYSNLEGVHHGDEASAVFTRMADMDPQEQEKHRQYLLKYCHLDTYAMVKLWEKLLEAAK